MNQFMGHCLITGSTRFYLRASLNQTLLNNVHDYNMPFRKPTLLLHDLCLEVLTVHCNELRLFEAKAFPLTLTINVTHLTEKQ